MKLAFYPGCSLEGMARDYADSIDAVFRSLEIGLVEIDDWSCCGATAAHSLSEMMAVALPARNIAAAEKMGLDVVVPCANCFNRMRFSQAMIRKGIFDVPWSVTGKTRIHDMTRFLSRDDMIEKIRRRLLRPLSGLKLISYYGCQMVRPPRITGFTDYENPQTLDRLAAAAGADVLDWSYKTTCCGASIGIGRRDIQEALTRKLLAKAVRTGADAIVVSCPLCQSNLDSIQADAGGRKLPIFYFTEVLRLALTRVGRSQRWLRTHIADPVPLLRARRLLP
ncbi:Heterodisulfide reductase subunit B-like protein [Olavius algarvensis associated proteobacterium Delta 3]|nr:Heterodisulfide reductase subunit B-like protein [Olavius algarvensis associated proteobacterium Delta 3]CAB5164194.1 Heterodisulfide reductase subunit B-like protein [Olavius algarvensis associated proteobacterium Delta 3]